ncbi:MAG: catalase family protein [Allosphingosinicella sp.]
MTDLTQFETLEPREEERTAHIIEVMRRMQLKRYPPGATLRDAHTRETAVLEAVFTVEPDLPEPLRVGLFAKPGRYDAWVRFSSSSDKAKSQAVKDLRGAAIKLRNVPGERIPESDEATTQDFVLMSTPTMPLGTVKLFHDAIYLITDWSQILFVAKMLLTGHLHTLLALFAANIDPTSPADIRYWSTTPYLFGPDRVVKYSLVPTSDYRSAKPEPLTATYLSDNLQDHLGQADATFDFMVQLRTDPATMPVEDAAVRWDEDDAPFAKVATLTIPRQNFRTAERDELSEALAFSPGHALVEHRPIGSVNRARLRVYREQSAFRQQRDSRRRVT